MPKSVRGALPRLVAHRGYAARFPENTLLAIQAAVEAGAHYLEFDVLLSADGVPVLFHDRDCMRMCDQPKAIHDYSYAKLQSFSVSEFGKFGYKFVGNRITSLQEVVAYLSDFPYVRSFVELKRQALQHFGIKKVLDTVLPIVSSLSEQAVIISYSLESLLATRERCALPIGAVFDRWSERKQPMIAKLRPEYLFTDIDELPRFGQLHCPQCELAVYECVDPLKAIKVHQRGVDLVETFAINEMQQALQLHSGRQ
jgi:glycerophosphoryl diester phosphodiesterase